MVLPKIVSKAPAQDATYVDTKRLMQGLSRSKLRLMDLHTGLLARVLLPGQQYMVP
jgi:hypothetical protein